MEIHNFDITKFHKKTQTNIIILKKYVCLARHGCTFS